MNELIILKWLDGKLIVDEDSLHHFGTDIPEGFDTPQGVYSIIFGGICDNIDRNLLVHFIYKEVK